MTVAELMESALIELNEDASDVTSDGWTPKYWDYSTFRNYTLKSIRQTARDARIQLQDVSLTGTVFYDTEIDEMPAFGSDIITYRLYPLPTAADDDGASAAYFYINSDTYEPKTFYYDETILEIRDVSYMDTNYDNWRETVGTPTIAVIYKVEQSSTGSTTPDHSADYTIVSNVQKYGTYATDAVEIELPEKLEDALVFNICSQALRKIGIEEDQNRAQSYVYRYREEVGRFDIDNLAGRIPTVKPVPGMP